MLIKQIAGTDSGRKQEAYSAFFIDELLLVDTIEGRLFSLFFVDVFYFSNCAGVIRNQAIRRSTVINVIRCYSPMSKACRDHLNVEMSTTLARSIDSCVQRAGNPVGASERAV